MSSIKLAPNASGTGALTIAAPNTNTDLTFNLGTALGQNNGSALVSTDANGNMGLGVAPSASWQAGRRAMQIGQAMAFDCGNPTQAIMSANRVFTGSQNQYLNNGHSTAYQQLNGEHAWLTAPSGTAGNAMSFTQVMTLDASGNLMVGTTTPIEKFTVNGWISANGQAGIGGSASTIVTNCNGGNWYGIMVQNLSTAQSNAMTFCNASTSVVGSIIMSNTGTAFNTSSDYRLKENIQPMTGALARNALLNPVKYKWKADGSDGEGFVAHELQGPFPQAVTGEKDAVDAEGKPVYQGIGTGPLDGHFAACVNELTALIQEQQAIIQTLTARIEALEAA